MTCAVCGKKIDPEIDRYLEIPSGMLGGEYIHLECDRDYMKLIDKMNKLTPEEFLNLITDTRGD